MREPHVHEETFEMKGEGDEDMKKRFGACTILRAKGDADKTRVRVAEIRRSNRKHEIGGGQFDVF